MLLKPVGESLDARGEAPYLGNQKPMIVTLEQIERDAMALSPGERAQLADRLWESMMGNKAFDVVMTPELERLLDAGLEGAEAAKSTDALRRSS